MTRPPVPRPEGCSALPWKTKSAQVRGRDGDKKGAKKDGGRVVAMSGGGRQKGDYRTGRFRTEQKTTDNRSYSLKLDELHKIEREALLTPPGLMPQMRVTIAGESFRVLRDDDWVALGLDA